MHSHFKNLPVLVLFLHPPLVPEPTWSLQCMRSRKGGQCFAELADSVRDEKKERMEEQQRNQQGSGAFSSQLLLKRQRSAE